MGAVHSFDSFEWISLFSILLNHPKEGQSERLKWQLINRIPHLLQNLNIISVIFSWNINTFINDYKDENNKNSENVLYHQYL